MTSLRDGLVAEYRLAGNAADTSGNGRHGVVHGAVPVEDRFGNPGQAYHFDGVDDYIEVSPPPAFADSALTVSAWARWDARDFRGWTNCVVAQDDGDDQDQSRRVFQISTYNGHIVWHRMIGARDPMDQHRVRADRWYHVVGVYGNGEHRLYVDGELRDAVKHVFWTHSAQPFHIGRKGKGEAFFYFRGAIDDVLVYDRALSGAEITALAHEDGWEAPLLVPAAGRGDPISGHWGRHGLIFLDLRYDGHQGISGEIMSRRPDNMARIIKGTFDQQRGHLRLEGNAKHPDSDKTSPFVIEGVLDAGEITVRADFGDFSGNFMLTHRGARLRPRRNSIRSHMGALACAVRHRLATVLRKAPGG